MKGLNLQSFKKVDDNDHSAVFENDKGHRITVAKKALSGKMKEQLKGLPLHKDAGGMIDPNAMLQDALAGRNLPPVDPNALNRTQEIYNDSVLPRITGRETDFPLPPGEATAKTFGAGGRKPEIFNPEAYVKAEQSYKEEQAANQPPQMSPQDVQQQNEIRARAGLAALPMPPGSEQPQAPQQQMQPPISGQASPFANMPGDNAFMKGLREGKQAINFQQQADIQRGALEKAALDKAAGEMDRFNAHVKGQTDAIMTERNNLLNDYKNGHIDPNRFFENTSTPQKISNAIGLILGGIGGAITGKGNPALDYLNRLVDNDIRSQMTDLDKKKGLLAANSQTFQDIHTASAVTRANLNDALAMKLKQAAADTSDPQARARALAAASQLDMQSHAELTNIAMRNAALQPGISPEMKIRFLVPEAQKEHVAKELGEAQAMVKGRDSALSAFDQASKLNTISNRLLSPIDSKRQIDALVQPVVAQLSKDTAGRFTEQDSQMLQSLFPAPGESDKTRNIKRSRIMQLMNQKMNFPRLKEYNISPTGRYESGGGSRIPEAPPMLRK